MIAPDLFGNEGRLPTAALRPAAPAPQLDLFDATAEARALESGRPRSQERAELLAPAHHAGTHAQPATSTTPPPITPGCTVRVRKGSSWAGRRGTVNGPADLGAGMLEPCWSVDIGMGMSAIIPAAKLEVLP